MHELPGWAPAYFTTLAFALGACVGSFLNVCIHRIPREESIILPRSHCPRCGSLIAWYDNLPLVSYLLLRARCRRCGGPIAPRYFLVELLTAVLFMAVWQKYGFDAHTPVYWLLAGGLILGTFVDLEHLIIPDRVSLGGMAAGLALSAALPALQGVTGHGAALGASALGLAAGAGLLWLVGALGKAILKKDAMGLGDVKLLGAIGAFLGWQAVLFTVVCSSLLGTLAGLALIATGRKEWQSRIPYGPYLAAAAVTWVLAGADWWAAYRAWLATF